MIYKVKIKFLAEFDDGSDAVIYYNQSIGADSIEKAIAAGVNNIYNDFNAKITFISARGKLYE